MDHSPPKDAATRTWEFIAAGKLKPGKRKEPVKEADGDRVSTDEERELFPTKPGNPCQICRGHCLPWCHEVGPLCHTRLWLRGEYHRDSGPEPTMEESHPISTNQPEYGLLDRGEGSRSAAPRLTPAEPFPAYADQLEHEVLDHSDHSFNTAPESARKEPQGAPTNSSRREVLDPLEQQAQDARIKQYMAQQDAAVVAWRIAIARAAEESTTSCTTSAVPSEIGVSPKERADRAEKEAKKQADKAMYRRRKLDPGEERDPNKLPRWLVRAPPERVGPNELPTWLVRAPAEDEGYHADNSRAASPAEEDPDKPVELAQAKEFD